MTDPGPSWADLLLDVRLARVTAAPPKAGPSAAVMHADALRDAGVAGAASLAASRGVALTLVVNDPHRFTDTRAFLASLLGMLDEQARGGEHPPELRMLVASGTHGASEPERRAHEERIVGPLRERFSEIAWHDALDDAVLAGVGSYRMHCWMAQGGVYVGCGSMEPHYFAGVTGAHKTLTVGVMSRASIEANHAAALSAEAALLRLAGNPVHEGVVAAVRALEASGATLLAINQVIVGGHIVGVTAGSPLEALERGLPLVRECFARAIERPVDLAIARVASPLDRDLYQADKGIKNTEAAVRDGGVLILDAACSHGVGIDHFVELLRAAPSHGDALRIIGERGYRLGDHKAVRLRRLTDERGVRVGLVSPAIDPDMSGVFGMRIFADRHTAATWASELLPPSARGVVVEDAGNVVVTVGRATGSSDIA